MSCWKHRQAHTPLPDLTGLPVQALPPAEPEVGNSEFEIGLRAWLKEHASDDDARDDD